MNIYISGGCKNGKSSYGQNRAWDIASEKDADLYYVATMIACDDEDRERINKHIEDRKGMGFITIEAPGSLHELKELSYSRPAVFLVDSVTALMANAMFGQSGFSIESGELLIVQMMEFLKICKKNDKDAILVSDNIYSDSIIYDDMTAEYMRMLGKADRILAEKCDEVMEVTFGNVIKYK